MMNNKLDKNLENIKCEILDKDYKLLSDLLIKMQTIIIKNENILMFSKSNSMKLLNNILKKLNQIYNDTIFEIYSNDNYSKISDVSILKNDSLYGNISELKEEFSELNTDNNSSEIYDD